MAHDELPHDILMARLAEMAATALPIYGLNPDSALTMINHSENTTFRIDDPATGRRTALRVHRNDYHSIEGIGSELAWMRALRDEAAVQGELRLCALNEFVRDVFEISGFAKIFKIYASEPEALDNF